MQPILRMEYVELDQQFAIRQNAACLTEVEQKYFEEKQLWMHFIN